MAKAISLVNVVLIIKNVIAEVVNEAISKNSIEYYLYM
jgi:hypothetical protein